MLTFFDNSDGWWHGSNSRGDWGAFPFGYVYCNLERDGVVFLVLPKDWAVHESVGNKLKVGVFDYETKTLMDVDGVEVDWSDAKLL